MSFYGSSFSFDGTSCEEYGLMLYDFASTTQGNSEFAKGMEILEERIPWRIRSLAYGAYYKQPLEFKLVFGVDEYTALNGQDIDRQEMEVISSWLTGHAEYKSLTIDQPDMIGIHYMCMITDLKVLEHAGNKWAFQCSVHCDSPFAYTDPETFTYEIKGSDRVVLHSRSSSNLPYYPKVSIDVTDGEISICNEDDGGRTFKISGALPKSDTYEICGDTGVVRSKSGMNAYPYFNFVFPRLIRGDNHLIISGNGMVTFTCEFPVNVGG